MKLKRYYPDNNDICEDAYNVYINSSFAIWKDNKDYYISDSIKSDPFKIGTLKDIESYLLEFK